jgi:hypothetical protein
MAASKTKLGFVGLGNMAAFQALGQIANGAE